MAPRRPVAPQNSRGHEVSREELAWAAGFFDGEGYIAGHNCRGSGQRLQIPQVDRRALDRFQRAMGFGKVVGPWPNGKFSPRYHYRVGRFAEVQAAIALMWTWLGPVKKEQARNALREVSARLDGERAS